MWRWIHQDLPEAGSETREHVKLLKETISDSTHMVIFDHLYECLSILDNKCSSLLTFNSVILAVYAVFVSNDERLIAVMYLGGAMLFALASSFLLLGIVWIHWSKSRHLADPERHATRLMHVRRSRTIRYRLAWLLSTGSISLLGLYLLEAMVRGLIRLL